MDINKEKELGASSSKATIGYTHDDYKAALSKNYNTNTGNDTTDYYNALKNESYKSLLNSEVQASIARDQAMKYTNNSLLAKGYANQGMAESTGLGIYSQYQAALANAKNTYQQSIDGINAQQRQETLDNQKDNFESVTTLMSNAADPEQLKNVLTTYGYMDGETGEFNTDAFNSLDVNSQKQLQILYSMYNSNLTTPPTTEMNSLEELQSGTYVGSGSKIYTLGENYNEEIKYLWHKGSNGEYENGESIKVKNGRGETIYLQWTGKGFKVVNLDTFNKSTKTHTLTWNSSSNGSITYK